MTAGPERQPRTRAEVGFGHCEPWCSRDRSSWARGTRLEPLSGSPPVRASWPTFGEPRGYRLSRFEHSGLCRCARRHCRRRTSSRTASSDRDRWLAGWSDAETVAFPFGTLRRLLPRREIAGFGQDTRVGSLLSQAVGGVRDVRSIVRRGRRAGMARHGNVGPRQIFGGLVNGQRPVGTSAASGMPCCGAVRPREACRPVLGRTVKVFRPRTSSVRSVYRFDDDPHCQVLGSRASRSSWRRHEQAIRQARRGRRHRGCTLSADGFHWYFGPGRRRASGVE